MPQLKDSLLTQVGSMPKIFEKELVVLMAFMKDRWGQGRLLKQATHVKGKANYSVVRRKYVQSQRG